MDQGQTNREPGAGSFHVHFPPNEKIGIASHLPLTKLITGIRMYHYITRNLVWPPEGEVFEVNLSNDNLVVY